MAVRKRGCSRIEVDGRRFVWYVHDETDVRIVSEDKRFAVSYRWLGEPSLAVTGPEFPRIAPTDPRPVLTTPPAFSYSGPADLARQIVRWALCVDGGR